MRNRRTLTIVAAFGAAFAVVSAVACSGGDVSQGDYDKVKQQLQDQQTQNQQLQQQLANAPKAASATATAAASATPAASASAGVTWILGAKKNPPVTPAPTLAPGQPTPTPKPKPTPPAALYEKVPYAIYMETLATTHQSGQDIAATAACTPSGRFVRGQRIVFRYEIIDTSTGKRITDLDGAKVAIVFPNGDTANGSFSQRGGGASPDAPFMWSSNWDVPKDYPLGGIAYKLSVTTKDGKTFTWEPPALADKALAEDTRPTVIGDLAQ